MLGVTDGANLLFGLITVVFATAAVFDWALARSEPGAGSPELRRMATFIAGMAATFLVLPERLRLFWLLALLPAGMIIHHAIALYIYRRPSIANGADRGPGRAAEPEFFESVMATAERARDTYFGVSTLALRYGIPAVLLMLFVVAMGYALFLDPVMRDLLKQTLVGAQFGFAGAYVYVVLVLSQRTFRRDITHGIAAWCAATLALGPILAGVLSLVWNPADPQAPQNDWGKATVYFFAGLAPRQVISIIQEAAKRLLHSDTQVSAHRVLPLSQVRGVTLEVQERLDEEGILDTANLAMADVFRLLRNTSFDARQLVSWIDEALLIVTLPSHWQKLEGLGFTGAIDLAYAAWQEDMAKSTQDANPGPSALQEMLGTDAPVVMGAARRLLEDAQVQQIWALYQSSSDAHVTP